MNTQEIIRRIDDDTNNYIRLFGEAPHMESLDNGAYRVIRPKKGEQGLKFICDVRPERLDKKTVRAVKRLKVSVWWGLLLPDDLRKKHKKIESSPLRVGSPTRQNNSAFTTFETN